MRLIPEPRREILEAVAKSTSLPTAFDIGLDLELTTRQAAARLRAAETDGQIESWRSPEGSDDRDIYWQLTNEGKALVVSEAAIEEGE